METFIPRKNLVISPEFSRQRQNMLRELEKADIDPPISSLIARLNALPCCFTIQCCHGHFVSPAGDLIQSLATAADYQQSGEVEYRIAYIACCIENSAGGKILLAALEQVSDLEPQYVQFGSAGWFWDQYPNSYVLQVEPERFACQDTALLSYREACLVEEVRDGVFNRLRDILNQF
ncbi:hypothetical protein JXO52_06640 [bacterium]|nr:hypothetical protein [bacterium]